MKRSIAALVAYFGLSFLACQDSSEVVPKPSPDLAYYRAIGELIPFETGMRWLDFYHEKSGNVNARTQLLGFYSISANTTNSMLASVTNATGVAFHYGTDILGIRHIIAIPVDESLELWNSIPGRLYVDCNSGNTISQSTASSWATRYKNANPGEVWFHFFGVEIFEEITSLPFFNSVDIEPALHDLNLTPEMLLIVWNELLDIGGRTNGGGCGNVYDASSACPPCSVH